MRTRTCVWFVLFALCIAVCNGCTSKEKLFDTAQEIGVISRESGSGTRGAFVELFDIQEADGEGNWIDCTTKKAVINSSTAGIMSTVAGDRYAIGYISLGSLNDSVKALSINGVEATAQNIKNGTYTIARPFHIATKAGLSEVAEDFISFILSADGQSVIESRGYLRTSETSAYSGCVTAGKVVISGSASISPVMESLREAYIAKNPGVTVEIQQSDSSTGIADVIDGTCDMGMVSRELKDSETAKGILSTVIAWDGIAVIVNPDNPLKELTDKQVREIFIGENTVWNQVIDE